MGDPCDMFSVWLFGDENKQETLKRHDTQFRLR